VHQSVMLYISSSGLDGIAHNIIVLPENVLRSKFTSLFEFVIIFLLILLHVYMLVEHTDFH
jgi:hypothetical protein